MSKDFAKTLKELRLQAGYTQKQVYEMLNIPQSTFSSWEIGKAEPSASMTLKLCELYHVDDILSAFGYDGYNEDGSIQLNIKEQDLIEKYRSLDPYGQETINYILNREVERVQQLRDARKESPAAVIGFQKKTGVQMYIYTYMHKIASAGNGFYFEDIPTDTIEAPYMNEADFIIGVSGDSMEPTYSDGDLVYVQKKQIIETGEIGIFIVNGECYIKEVGEDGLISHNHKYNTIPGTEHIICVGKVLGKLKSD